MARLMWLQYLTDRHGGEEAFQAVIEGEENAWSDESILYALEQIQWLAENGGFDETFTSVTADQNEDARLLADGEAAMLLQGSWVYATIHETSPTSQSRATSDSPSSPCWRTVRAIRATSSATRRTSGRSPPTLGGGPGDRHQLPHRASLQRGDGGGHVGAGVAAAAGGIEDQIAASEDADFLEFANELVSGANHFQLSWDQAVSPEQAQPLMENLENILMGSITPEEFAENMNALQN